MLNDTITLFNGEASAAYVRRSNVGSSSTFVPQGDTPLNERKIRVSHEVTKSGTVNSLFAVSHLKSDPANAAAAPRAAAVQIKIIRPPFATQQDMLYVIKEAISGLCDGAEIIDLGDASLFDTTEALLNQES